MINTIDICTELGQNFIDFSYETNSCRAFADARDGLKPGQRACLWEMFTKGYSSSKAHVKSAKIAGGVVGTWWPHGDTAIYDTFTRMSQKWINNIPEVDWHGNNGSQIVPDAAAASRYTEARLSKVVEEGMFSGIKKNNVNMIWNYSEDEQWPEVLPATLPRLLLNGCQGIGSTIANVWLPHNLIEVGEILCKYISSGELDYSNLYPDFPVGCQIINKNSIHTIYETGKGKVILRARAEIKDNHIYFRELPYQVYVEPLIEKIKEMVTKEEIEGIDAIYNRSSKKGIEIDIECNINPQSVLLKLYNKTDLQKSYSANQWALVGKTPKLLTLKDYCKIYVEHNIKCIVREAEFDMKKAMDRLHIVNGLLKALEDIDNIIALIKKSASAAAAKDSLMEKYNFTEIQAKAILAMKLSSLANLEKVELQNEKAGLEGSIKKLNALINNTDLQKTELKERLNNIVKKYGDARRTEVTNIVVPKEDKEIEEVVPEDCVVILSQGGDIKRVASNSFKVQRRNGKGVKTENDAIFDTIATNTVDTLMVFTNKGKMFRLLVDAVPAGTNVSKGVQINSLINMEPGEKVAAITSLYRKTNAKYVLFITKRGLMKKTEISEYMKVKRSTGIAAINIKDGDAIANVTFVKDERMILVTKQGMSIHVETKDINPIGRVTAGVKGIKLADNDEVIIGIPIHDEKDCIAIFTSKGYSKKTALDEFPLQNRSGKGVVVYKPTDITGEIVGAAMISNEDNILLIGKPNSICIPAKDIPSLGRPSIGNIMMKNSIINNIVKL